MALAVPRLVLVTDRHATGGRDLVDVVRAALDAGLPAVQLRDKDLEGGALFALAERLRAETAARGALLLVNGRVDVAVAVGADGVQLGTGALSVADARRLLPPESLVGVSTHTAAEVAAAAEADFVLFGPIYPTPGKTAVGCAALTEAVRAGSRPVLAIGGVAAAQVPELRAAGASGVAVIRGILATSDPAAATRALLSALTPSTSRTTSTRGGPPMNCIFCRIVRGEIPAEVVARTDDFIAFLDVQPLADGHVLVVPVAHEACVEDLEPAQADALFRAVTVLAGPVREAVDAAGTTIGINNGTATGQTIPHVHVHIVPRWQNDGAGSVHTIFPRKAYRDIKEVGTAIRAAVAEASSGIDVGRGAD